MSATRPPSRPGRRALLGAALGAAAAPLPWPGRAARAQAPAPAPGGHAQPGRLPGRQPGRLIVPYPPGGITDLVARRVAEALGQRQGRAFVVENRPGAGGNLAAEAAARAAPNGDTLYMGFAGTHAMNISLYPRLTYDPVRDFTPIGLLVESPLALTLHPSVPATTLAELTAYARAHPGALAFGSSGNGGASHRALELYKAAAGLDILHVPYRGAAAANTDLLGGKIQGMFDTLITAMPNIGAGGVRALAVTGRQRSPLLPGVPTMAEAGLADYLFVTWLGLLAPAGLPAAQRDRLSEELHAIMADPAMVAWCGQNGLEPTPSSPEEFAAYMAAETERFARFVRETGMRIE
ncbi:tripartite tricarboxylate transporter substrate binding protein [Roseomonas sp. GC11]|uniref:Bug family tripartite tricarboxylate transporter substrate binding protein n=1 Tax=Roseomonas sp. GC11 TaxID=2950546 RepID=UPI00210AC1E1|nr:tripartite tricarboxylate transporter substrate binding protein [Roseomonas sp. GC11]MCQ4160008.1 tripartite tricarboxylate transporter substrate binding protein [Roseomonas sp. GC11]